jgi:hypothetical protein
MKRIGSNIIKLEGYGVYVTLIDDKLYTSEIDPSNGHPTLDPDKCISWDELIDPANQKFLNIVNAEFGLSLTMHDFNGYMSIKDIKEYEAGQRKLKAGGK